ncbi:MAG: hypothetical protein Tsb0015_14850 [Simkaniaceae bacterium]
MSGAISASQTGSSNLTFAPFNADKGLVEICLKLSDLAKKIFSLEKAHTEKNPSINISKEDIRKSSKETLESFEFLKQDTLEPGTSLDKFMKSYEFHTRSLRDEIDNSLIGAMEKKLELTSKEDGPEFLSNLFSLFMLALPEEKEAFCQKMMQISGQAQKLNSSIHDFLGTVSVINLIAPGATEALKNLTSKEVLFEKGFFWEDIEEALKIIRAPSPNTYPKELSASAVNFIDDFDQLRADLVFFSTLTEGPSVIKQGLKKFANSLVIFKQENIAYKEKIWPEKKEKISLIDNLFKRDISEIQSLVDAK